MSKPYIPNDRLARKAREENFRARSVYKLEELDRKFNLIQPNVTTKVLDIGAAPGSWLQYTSHKLGEKGKILGLDLQEIKPISPNVTTVVCDVTSPSETETAIKSIGWQQVDLVLSDVAPSTTGISEMDHAQSIELNRQVFGIAKKYLKPKGKLVMKVFDGQEFKSFLNELNSHFSKVTVTKSHASRDRSRELYVACQ